MRSNVLTFIFLLICFKLLYGQANTDWEPWEVSPVENPQIERPAYKDVEEDQQLRRETSESRLLMMSLIRAYQLILSAQDVPTCNFHPSCSRFGFQALKKYGVIQGFLMTSDRVQRCNFFKYGHYPLKNGYFEDPIDRYKFIPDPLFRINSKSLLNYE